MKIIEFLKALWVKFFPVIITTEVKLDALSSLVPEKKIIIGKPLDILIEGDKFGWRIHPITGKKQFHPGQDFRAVFNSPAKSAIDGKVISRFYDTQYGGGNTIIIENVIEGKNVRVGYCHFEKFGEQKIGDWVMKGDIVGFVGSTGKSTGNHLHFSVTINGEKVNPLDYIEN